jgi:TonB-dependent SusC/RagA subfamily outer membrane receptor
VSAWLLLASPLLISLLTAVAARPLAAQDATGVITGTVTDRATSQPLQVQVQVVGTTLGAGGDERGRYLIRTAPVGARSLRFVRIGYRPEVRQVTVAANDTARVDVAMSMSAVELEAVVTTGTGGAVEKRELGSTMGTLDVARVQELVPVNTLGQALQGRIASVRSVAVGGGVGTAKDLRIRGTSSFTLGQRPIVYLDGVRLDTRAADWTAELGGQACCNFNGGTAEDRLGDINPDDIERVEILKGAAAATLYGSEASNGVIQIFTKKGRQESRPSWSMGLTGGFNRQRENYPTKLYPRFTGPDGTRALDLNETLIENGPYQAYDVSVNGGTGRATYYVSGAFSKEEGSIQPNDQTRGSLRLNVAWSPNDQLNFEARSSFARNRINALQSGNNWTALTGNASNGDPRNATAERPYGEAWVPVSDITEMQSVSDANRYTGGLTINYAMRPNFTHRLTFGLDATSEQKGRLFPFEGDFGPAGVQRGERDLGFRDYQTYTLDYLGQLNFTLPAGITSNFSYGGQGFFETQRLNMAIGNEFAGPGVTTVSSAARTFGREDYSRTVNLGLLAQNRFGYRDRLFATVGVRMDGNSAFGDDYGFQTYPKFDVAYNIAPAGFLPAFVSALKVRGAVGTAGRFPGAFDEFRTFAPIAVYQNTPAVSPSNPGNPDLAPETTTEYEAGFESGFFSDRLGVEGTVYRSITKDALIEALLPPSQGFTEEQQRNIGEIRNNGWELSVNWLALQRGRFDWRTEVRADGNENEITDMGGVLLTDDRFRVNYPVGGVWSRKITGYSVVEGVPTFTRSDTAVFFGPPLPTSNFSWGNTFTFGPFQLYGLLTAERGAWFSNGDRPYRVRQQAGDEYLSTLDAEGNPTFSTDSLVALWSSVDDIQKRDNVRLREISLVYQLPETLTGRVGFGRSTLTLSAQNVQWWDDCHCVDPNMNWEGAASFNQGSGFLADPAPRQFRASIRTRF